jgi:hypothetical protein
MIDGNSVCKLPSKPLSTGEFCQLHYKQQAFDTKEYTELGFRKMIYLFVFYYQNVYQNVF